MDAFLSVPMADVLAEIPVEDAIKHAFCLGDRSGTGRFLKWCLLMNRGCEDNGLNPPEHQVAGELFAGFVFQSVRRVGEILAEAPALA